MMNGRVFLSVAFLNPFLTGALIAGEDLTAIRFHARSHLRLDGVDLYLYAATETTTTATEGWCAAEEGETEYRGDFEIIAAKNNITVSKIDLGETFFVNNHPYDGLHQMRDPKTGRDLIVLFQYGSCADVEMKLFRLDTGGHVSPVAFVSKDGTKLDSERTSPNGSILMSKNND